MADASPPVATSRTRTDLIRRAEIRVPTSEFDADMRYFIDALGLRLDRIWPADYPSFAALSGHGTAILLERSTDPAPVTLRLYADDPAAFAGGETSLTTPGGHRIAVADANPPLVIPESSHEFIVRRLVDSESWVIGRAGMHYRDLLPDRLGGAIIASHIRIADAGPVADMVHFHTVGFQLIFCHRGWVRLVYEDQGPPFVLGAGDCAIQPPEIRHRVLEASAGVEVIEIGVPAEHLTSIDHEMELPTPHFRPEPGVSRDKVCPAPGGRGYLGALAHPRVRGAGDGDRSCDQGSRRGSGGASGFQRGHSDNQPRHGHPVRLPAGGIGNAQRRRAPGPRAHRGGRLRAAPAPDGGGSGTVG